MDEASIFAAALEKPPAERAAFLDGVCAADPALKAKVASLLQAHAEAGGFLESPSADGVTVDRSPILERPGSMVGPYRLMEEIGEGGFGLVFVAEQQQPIRRKVALKIIKPGMDTKEVIARFEAERQALALMDHPNIARVFDAGTTDSGRPYFVMELVKGIPAIDYCDQQRLTTRERLEIFVSICQAVQHAHAKGIIHRDLKPSNILVAPHDGKPVVKVIDFGIAKAIGPRLTDKTVYTRLAQMIGTPLYMSPEQAEVNALDVDTRSDIYSLGVLLYELLTGTTPFDQARFATAAHEEIRRIIREEEPPRPSKRLSTLGQTLTTVSAQRKTQPARLSALVRGDLDWIVMKALEKDRTRRYATANSFAGDIQRHLNHEPVEARPPSMAYRFRKFARRNKVMFATGTLVAVALLLGIVGTTWQAIEANRARREAVLSKYSMQDERDRAEELAEQQRRQRYISDMNLAWEAWERNDVRRARELLDRFVRRDNGRDLRGLEWYCLDNLCRKNQQIEHQVQLTYGAMRVAVSPSDGNLAVALQNNSVDVVDRRGRKMGNWGAGNRVWLPACVQFSKDGTRLFGPAANTRNILVRNWPSKQAEVELTGHKADVYAISVSPNDALLASADSTGRINIWSLMDGRLLSSQPAHDDEVYSIAFSNNTLRLASSSIDGTVRIWQWTGAKLELESKHEEHFHRVFAVAFSHDDRLLASGGEREIIVWDVAHQEQLLAIDAHDDSLRTLEFSSDDKVLLSSSRDKSVKLWDVETGALLSTKRFHSSIVTGATFLDDETVASVGFEGVLAIWPIDRSPDDSQIFMGGRIRDLAFSADSRRLFAVRWTPRGILERDLEDGTERVLPDSGDAQTVAVDQTGLLAVGDESGRVTLRRLDAADGAVRLLGEHAGAVYQVVFTRQGDRLASYGAEGAVKIWDTHTGQLLDEQTFEPPKDPVAVEVGIVAFSPDGRILAWVDGANRITLYDLASHDYRYLDNHKHAVLSIAFSPDGSMLASADWHGTIYLWELQPAGTPMTNPNPILSPMWVRAMVFSPDGQSLMVASGEGKMRFWDLETLQQKCSFATRGTTCLRVSPDGKKLAGGGFDGFVSILRIP